MELSKNIFFNTDKLIQNTKVKISYTGKLFQEHSNDVFLHYGFDNEWKDLTLFTDTGRYAYNQYGIYLTLKFRRAYFDYTY